jgi:putative ABC transport system permease protein
MSGRPGPRRRPSAPLRFLLHLILPKDEREFFLGDLQEGTRRSWRRELFGALALRISSMSPFTRRGGDMLSDLGSDVRHGVRATVRNPGFALVGLATLALGIGANTTMFAIVNGVVLQPLPYPKADRLVMLYERLPSRGLESVSISPLDFQDWRERNRSMKAMAAYRPTTVNYTGGAQPERLAGYLVSEDFFQVLGIEPSRGRGFSPDDMAADGSPVVVLSHGFWLRALGGDDAVLGHTIMLDGVAHTVVGVLPPRWRPPTESAVDVVLPIRPEPFWQTSRGYHFLYGIGRLGPGVTLAQAQSDFSSISAALEEEYPDTNRDWGAVVRSLDDALLGSTRPQLLVFMAAVSLVLLIGCANLASMTLARATARARDLSIRVALGAGRGRMLRQLLTESALLSGAGGLLGLGIAFVALKVLVAGWPTLMPRMSEVAVTPAVVLLAVVLSVLSGLLFGFLPSSSAPSERIADGLRQGARGLSGGTTRRWTRAILVSGEVALAVMLLVASGLLVRSFINLRGDDAGFEASGRLVLSTPLPRSRYPSGAEQKRFADATLTRLGTLPGVKAVAQTSLLPLSGGRNVWGYWLQVGTSTGSESDGSAVVYRVSPGYFDVMGIPLLEGRAITTSDREDGPPVAVISAKLAAHAFPHRSPIGEHMSFDPDSAEPPAEVVGVVGDIRPDGLGRTSLPQVYVPFRQRPTPDVSFVLETSVAPTSLASGVRRAVAAVDPELPIVGLQTAESLIENSISLPRLRTLLMTAFGVTALLLALVGLYGLLAYTVSQRTHEIGIRLALGASRGTILGLVFREGARLVGIGIVVGLAGAVFVSRVLEAMLFEVDVHDPMVFSAVPLFLAAVALVAILVPARRASRVDPVRTLSAAQV